MRDRASRVYWLSIRTLPFIFVGGFVTGLVGGYLRNRSVWNAGGAIFLLGGAIWGVANGGFLGWSYVRAERKLGGEPLQGRLAANPMKSVMFILLTMFLIAAGIGLMCAAWRSA